LCFFGCKGPVNIDFIKLYHIRNGKSEVQCVENESADEEACALVRLWIPKDGGDIYQGIW
jgi:hypothetical protein